MKSLCIYDDNAEFHEWWLNFDNEHDVVFSSYKEDLANTLASFGGRFSAGFWTGTRNRSVCLEFENDEDALAFVLRWS